MLIKATHIPWYLAILLCLLPCWTFALETEFSGSIKTQINNYTSNQTEKEAEVEVDSVGLKKEFSKTQISFDEAEVKLEVSGDLIKEWKAFGVLEITLDQEIGEDSTLEISEATVNIHNEKIQFSLGIDNDDLADFQGEVDLFSIGGLEASTVDDGIPAISFSYLAIEDMGLKTILRSFHEEGDDEEPRSNHMQFRVELELERDWGMVQSVYDNRTSSVEDPNQFKVMLVPEEDNEEEEEEEEIVVLKDAGKYRDEAQLLYVALQPYLFDEKLKPFLTYGVLKTFEKEAVKKAITVEITDTSWVGGIDWIVTEQTTLTAAMNSQTRKKNKKARLAEEERNRVEELTGYGIAANYQMEPIEVQLGFSTTGNNHSDLKKKEKDHWSRNIDLQLEFSF